MARMIRKPPEILFERLQPNQMITALISKPAMGALEIEVMTPRTFNPKIAKPIRSLKSSFCRQSQKAMGVVRAKKYPALIGCPKEPAARLKP